MKTNKKNYVIFIFVIFIIIAILAEVNSNMDNELFKSLIPKRKPPKENIVEEVVTNNEIYNCLYQNDKINMSNTFRLTIEHLDDKVMILKVNVTLRGNENEIENASNLLREVIDNVKDIEGIDTNILKVGMSIQTQIDYHFDKLHYSDLKSIKKYSVSSLDNNNIDDKYYILDIATNKLSFRELRNRLNAELNCR